MHKLRGQAGVSSIIVAIAAALVLSVAGFTAFSVNKSANRNETRNQENQQELVDQNTQSGQEKQPEARQHQDTATNNSSGDSDRERLQQDNFGDQNEDDPDYIGPPRSCPGGEVWYVNAEEGTEFKADRDAESATLRVIPYSGAVTLDGCSDGTWIQVTHNGEVGYVLDTEISSEQQP